MLNRCEGSRRSTDGSVGCREECELYPSFAPVCIFVHTFSTHACVHVCFHLDLAAVSVGPSVGSVGAVLVCQLVRSPLTRRLSGSPGTQTAATAMPSHNSSAKSWTGREEARYHESRMSLALRPRWTDSRRLPHPKPNLRPFKSADLSQSSSSSFHSSLRPRGPFSTVSGRHSSTGSLSSMKLK